MDLVDIYDEYINKTGKILKRNKSLLDNEYKIAVRLLIKNDDNLVLIQKRSENKKRWPLYYDFSVGGGLLSGETPVMGIIRETKEELGIEIKEKNLSLLFITKSKNRFDYIFLIKYEKDYSFNLLKSEVDSIKWANIFEIQELINQNKFLPYEYIDEINEKINSNETSFEIIKQEKFL